MYYVCKPTKVQIYINTAMKSAAQIQRELGCDVLINGGLYDMTWYTPCCWLRADGKTLHSEGWSDWGYGWNDANPRMDTSDNIMLYQNFISCVALIKDGHMIRPLTYDAALGGERGRSAIGTRTSGEVVVWCASDGAFSLTPEQLQSEMMNLGCRDALMLDGGASSQCITPIGNIQSNRIVQNYIAMWTKADEPKEECPYAEPTHNVRWGSIGNGAKWVQWQLNRHGASLDVDGWFFNKSVDALKKFQHDHGLAWDGVCGPLTKEALKK